MKFLRPNSGYKPNEKQYEYSEKFMAEIRLKLAQLAAIEVMINTQKKNQKNETGTTIRESQFR